MASTPHIPVLSKEVLAFLAPKSGGVYCDCTLGAGGHTKLILQHSAPDGRVIAIDRDKTALSTAATQLGNEAERVTFVHGAFGDVRTHLADIGQTSVDGFLVDLGVSSMQLDQAARGFSFSKEGPIDMRMDTSCGETALELLQRVSEEELVNILSSLGEERFSKRIARRLKEDVCAEKLSSTLDLANSVSACIPAKQRHASRIHPATRTFQALRLAVNQELSQLTSFLEAFPDLLAPKGRCVIISFHSLEDRLVKRTFRDLAKTSSLPPNMAEARGERVNPICVPLTRKPVMASLSEIETNPRARSAKLRACEKAAT